MQWAVGGFAHCPFFLECGSAAAALDAGKTSIQKIVSTIEIP
jgi:hypothetical protein